MFKSTSLMTTLLTTPVTFSALAQAEAAHANVSAVSSSPFAVEDAIAKLAQEKSATSWRTTSIRVDSSAHATAILYK